MPIFLANIFLFFGFAALIPVFLHLLYKKKPQPVWFAAMQFLRDAVAQTRRSRYLTQCFTLLLRILIFLLLALAFSRPLVHFEQLLPHGSRTIILVLDSSASMQMMDGGISRFEIARSWAQELLRDVGPGDKIALLAPGAEKPELIYPPVSMLNSVRKELQSMHPGFGRAELFAFLSDKLRQEQGSMKGVEVHIFSDFQKSDCAVDAVKALCEELASRQALIYLNNVAAKNDGANATLSEVKFMPPAVVGNGLFKARIRAHHNAAFSDSMIAHLQVDGQMTDQLAMSGDLSGDGGGDLTAPPGSYGRGNVTGVIRLEPDAFSADHQYYFSLPHLQEQPAVMVYGSGKRDCFYLEKAIAPGGNVTSLLQVETVSWKEFMAGDYSRYPYVFLCNLQEFTATVQEKLQKILQNGGMVFVFPGENLGRTPNVFEQTDFWPGLSCSLKKYSLAENKNILANDRTDELVRTVTREIPPPWSMLTRQRLQLHVAAGQKMPWVWEDGGSFALSAKINRGKIWLFSVTANRDWSSWPMTPFFLILTQELIKSSVEQDALSYQGEIGMPFRLSWMGGNALTKTLQCIAPDGKKTLVTLNRKTAEEDFWCRNLRQPGIYELSDSTEPEKIGVRIAVNIAASEKDISLFQKHELLDFFKNQKVWYSSSLDVLRGYLADRRDGRPLWPGLLLLAFVLSMAEVLFANLRSVHSVKPAVLRGNKK